MMATENSSRFREYPMRVKLLSRGSMTLSLILTFSMPSTGLLMGKTIFLTNLSFFIFVVYVLYGIFNVMGNWYLFLKQASVVERFYIHASDEDLQDTRVVGGEGSTRMHYACHLCKCIIAKGTHHCGLCGHCIPQRDHHCFFLGSCVGQHNLRYFCAFCLHVGIACLVFVYIGITYGNVEYKELFSRDFLYYFVPYALAKYIIQEISGWHFILVLLIYLAFSTGVVALIYSLSISFKVIVANSFPKSLPQSFFSDTSTIPSFGPGWKLGFLIPVLFNMKQNNNFSLTKLV